MEAGQIEPRAETPKNATPSAGVNAEAKARGAAEPSPGGKLATLPKLGEWFWQTRRMGELRRRARLETTDYFFHTVEEDKRWVEIDLGAPQRISTVIVENRKDYCADRAVPLAIEVSVDRDPFQQVAREDEVFDSLRAKFEQVVEVRHVRARVSRRTMLHLSLVRVLPS